MNSQLLLTALGLALVLEGLLPFLVPAAWRRAFSQILQMRDGQIRFFGLISMACGLTLVWLFT